MVLEIGGIPDGYLKDHATRCVLRTNTYHVPGLDALVDAQFLPFPSQTFDLVFMVAVDYYIPDLEKAFREIYRVSKPGATFINASYTKRTLDFHKKIDLIALHSLKTSEYLNFYAKVGFAATVLKILNNPPRNQIKRFIWTMLPRALLIFHSQWRIFICKK